MRLVSICVICLLLGTECSFAAIGPYPYPPRQIKSMAHFFFIRIGDKSPIMFSRLQQKSEFDGGGEERTEQTFLEPGDCIFISVISYYGISFELMSIDYEKTKRYDYQSTEHGIYFFTFDIDKNGNPISTPIQKDVGKRMLLQCREALPFSDSEQ